MIQALSPDRADEPFDVPILPGRPRCGWSIPNSHGSEASRYGMAIRGISVPNEILGCLIPGEGFGDLSGDPFGGRIGGDVDPHQVASLKLDDHQGIEQLEANGRHDKHINGGDVRRMIAEKGLPALRWRPTSAYHVLGDSRLGDIEVQLEQLAVDTRRSPQWVRPAHFANKGAQLSWDPRSADAIARSPAPIGPKANTVPANDRLRPDDRNGACGRGEPAIEPNKQKAIDIRQSRPLWHPPTKHVDLLPEDQILCLPFGSRLKRRSQDGKNQPEQGRSSGRELTPFVPCVDTESNFRYTQESAVFSADGGRVLTASTDMTARLWEAANGKELAVLR